MDFCRYYTTYEVIREHESAYIRPDTKIFALYLFDYRPESDRLKPLPNAQWRNINPYFNIILGK